MLSKNTRAYICIWQTLKYPSNILVLSSAFLSSPDSVLPPCRTHFECLVSSSRNRQLSQYEHPVFTGLWKQKIFRGEGRKKSFLLQLWEETYKHNHQQELCWVLKWIVVCLIILIFPLQYLAFTECVILRKIFDTCFIRMCFLFN